MRVVVVAVPEAWQLWICEEDQRLAYAGRVSVDDAIAGWRIGEDRVLELAEEVKSNVLTGKVLNALNNASSTLRSQASAFGANLSIVQIRQDFAKNIINVLQTGSANLTLADSNEEAANSQALSTRQSIAVSALALSNQAQQSVLQLLR